MFSSRNIVFVVASLVAAVFLSSTLNAAPVQWWSADLQPTTATPANSFTGSPGDVWNVLTVAHWSTKTTNPSWSLVNNMGIGNPDAPVTFSIPGTVSSYNGNAPSNPIGCDYLLWVPSGTTNPLPFQFSGLTPGGKYELTLIGGGQYSSRYFNARVDLNGDGSLADETAIKVANGDWDKSQTTPNPLHSGLIILSFPPTPINLPPYVTFSNITAGGTGMIIGDALGVSEGNWAGFQLREIPEPSTLVLLTSGLLGLLCYAWRKRK